VIKKKNLSQEDKKTWDDYLKNPTGIYDKDKKNFKSIKSGRFKFDLHGYTLDGANTKVREIMLLCIKEKYSEILLITGKGLHSHVDKDIYASKDLGKLRFSVPEFIKSDHELSKFIISINEAKPKEGGEGAILIKLKNL
tara:strand:+ start:30 stop:446 length:417 start_codon:yes stop_codon:yes gene_type:complete